MKLLTVFAAVCFTYSAYAQLGAKLASVSMINAGGSHLTFTNCTVTAVEPDGVRVLHDSGTAKIPYEFLPPEMQAALQFNPERAREYREQKRMAQAASSAAIREAVAAQQKAEAAALAKPQAAAAGVTPTLQAVTLTGDVLPLHRTRDERLYIIRLYPGGQLVCIGDMRLSNDKNGGSITLTAYPTGKVESFENQVVPVYSVNRP